MRQCHVLQTNINSFLGRENQTLEDYLRRVHPNMDLSAVIDPKQTTKSKKRGDTKQDSFQPLTAEEKANICSHQLDYVLQKIGEVQRKGEDEISEVPLTIARQRHATSMSDHPTTCRLAQMYLFSVFSRVCDL